jgi:hypothetical protein
MIAMEVRFGSTWAIERQMKYNDFAQLQPQLY